ncbi:low temperature requirement protein A [Micromonospora sp. NPDC047620]|uniref:low temperature requirement protein A n=1 Tax=Micromonospora sp. NPDC047620 TaxID=3364251 RepID=UPI0037192A23
MTEQSRVATEELFLDVVFVFAFIQVTTLMTAEAGELGVLHGLLVLTILWWSWSLFAWLGNRAQASYGMSRLVILSVTPIMFVLTVTISEAFTDVPGGTDTSLAFVACFAAVRVLYLALRIYATPGLRRVDLAALTVPMVVAVALLLIAALLPRSALGADQARAGQVVLWLLAIIVDYGAGQVLRVPERQIFSARHWAERHNLIMIVALGEVLVSVGIAGGDEPGSPGLIIASALAVVVAGALEWIYFDLSALIGERALRGADQARRVTLARDGYTYLHLPMIAGIILLALGLKHVPSLVGDAHAYRRGDPLDSLGRYAMYGGVALFMLAHAAFQWRLSRAARALVWPRVFAAILLVALIPVIARRSALAALAWLSVICVVTAVIEFFLSRPERRRLREALSEEDECPNGEPPT